MREVEGRKASRPVRIALERGAGDPGLPAIAPAEGGFGQREAAQVPIVVVAEAAVVPRAGDGCAHRDEAFARQKKASDQAPVEPARVEPLAERGAGGSCGANEGAA